MTTQIYLYLNAILYLVFGTWCAIMPDWTAQAVGFYLPSKQGFAEYVAVYGGLEFGVGVFFLIAALKKSYQIPGVVFGACFYLGIFMFRTIAITNTGFDIGAGVNFYISEAILSVWSLYLVKINQKSL